VSIQEGEALAKQYNSLFFEVSARNNINIKKLLFSSIAELPYFEQYKTNRMADIVGELEVENNETIHKSIADISIMDTGRTDLNIQNGRPKTKQNKNCGC
jgi:hypothetical protein